MTKQIFKVNNERQGTYTGSILIACGRCGVEYEFVLKGGSDYLLIISNESTNALQPCPACKAYNVVSEDRSPSGLNNSVYSPAFNIFEN